MKLFKLRNYNETDFVVMRDLKINLNLKNITGFIIGPVIFLLILFFVDLEPGKPEVTYTLAIAFIMAVWWITEIIPLSVTSLLPVVLFPVLGVMNGKEVSSTYFNYVIFLFAGGFLVALAMEKWNLHRRIALRILLITGTSPLWLLFGFMLASAFLSMWISNTATVMMMLPIIMSIISQLELQIGKKDIGGFSTAILLGVAYAASIGGISTLVGTPPNPILVQVMHIMFPNSPDISFFDWFVYALPIAVIMFVFAWLFLFYMFRPKTSWRTLERNIFRKQYDELGKIGYEEKIILIDFILLAVLWLTRSGIEIGSVNIPGWGQLFRHPEYLNDGTVAIAMSLLLFLIPSKSKKGKRIMSRKMIGNLPWGILLLFGGGFALARGFKVSGLSEWFGYQLASAAGQPHLVMIIFVAIGMTFLTELTSNTATTQLILPILAGLSVSLKVHPLLLMLPATISASMAFMLPVATPPNAIVFSSRKISIGTMARTGFILNIVGAIVITLITYYWGTLVFGFESGNIPLWAIPAK